MFCPLGGRKVYDVTSFLDSHPGGSTIILEFAGKNILLDLNLEFYWLFFILPTGQDATTLFEDIDHSPSAHQLLNKFFIGYLLEDVANVSEDQPSTAIAEKLIDESTYEMPAVVNASKYIPQTPQVQCGDVELSSRIPYKIQRSHQIPITFSYIFPKIPQVAVFVNFVDMDSGRNTRIVANAMNVSPSGFLLELGTYGDSKLWKLRVSWVASIHPSVQIVNLSLGGTGEVLPKVARVRVSYPHPVMLSSALPTICVGMNHLDMGKKNNRRLKIDVEKVTNMDTTLAIHMWDDTVSWQIGVSVLILSDPSVATTLLPNNFQNSLSQTKQPQTDFVNVYPKNFPMNEDGLVTRACVATIPVHETPEDTPVVVSVLTGLDIHKHSVVRVKVSHHLVSRRTDNVFCMDLRATFGPQTTAYGVQYNALVLSRTICGPPQFLEEIQQD